MYKIILFPLSLFISFFLVGQSKTSDIHYQISMPNPSAHYFDVVLEYPNPADTLVLKIPAWTPGGYFLTQFGDQLTNFSANDENGQSLEWSKEGNNWTVATNKTNQVTVRYRIECERPFIDTPWVEDTWGLISPTGIFLYTDEALTQPVKLTVTPDSSWTGPVATDLRSVKGSPNTFIAENFDILYDSPILVGNLEILGPVFIQDIPHFFIGRDLDIDRELFMKNLEKLMTEAIAIIDDIPYEDYKFLSIGAGPGGLEHLNSTVVSFRSSNFLTTPETRFRNYKLLAHEYFHLYNAKRIRPVELGPFDYSGPNYTSLLWFAEGVTEYYAHLMMVRAGLASTEETFRSFQNIIRNYENKPGHLYQSLTEASLTVWDNSPFSKTKVEADRTISYYEKGCILGLLLDLEIRQQSQNSYSLDDVMKYLYEKYYQELGRGFTDAELQAACESFAGSKLDEVFSYASTTTPVDYPKYFAYAGLEIDTTELAMPYIGFTTGIQLRNYMILNSVEENGPAWNAGLRKGDTLLTMEGKEPSMEVLNDILLEKKSGETFTFRVKKNGKEMQMAVTLGSKPQKIFSISEMKKKSKLQKSIYQSWKNGK